MKAHPPRYAWGLVVEVVPHASLLDRAREVASTIASIPAEHVQEVRQHVRRDRGPGVVGQRGLVHRVPPMSQEWMAQRFDQNRLAAERAAIIARGRSQGAHGPSAATDSGTGAVDPA